MSAGMKYSAVGCQITSYCVFFASFTGEADLSSGEIQMEITHPSPQVRSRHTISAATVFRL